MPLCVRAWHLRGTRAMCAINGHDQGSGTSLPLRPVPALHISQSPHAPPQLQAIIFLLGDSIWERVLNRNPGRRRLCFLLMRYLHIPRTGRGRRVEVPHGAPRKGVEQGPMGSRFGSYEAKPSDIFGRESLAFPEYLLHARQCAGCSHVLPH